MRIDNKQRNIIDKNTGKEMERFSLRIGKYTTQFEALKEENWIETFENFDFRSE